MTIVRVGLAETKDYGDGWNAIFGKKRSAKPAKASAAKKKPKQNRKKK